MAANGAAAKYTAKFPLDPAILGPGGAAEIVLSSTTDRDAIQAILDDSPFPERQVDTGRIEAKAGTGTISLAAPEGTIQFGGSAGFKTGIGVLNSGIEAIKSLQLDGPPKLDLGFEANPDSRFLSMVWKYNLSGQFSGRHPLGVLGKLSAGLKANASGLFAVLHRFSATTGARSAIVRAVRSFRLPAQISEAADLSPGTWLIAECDGSLAFQAAASLGYDLHFVRKLNLLNVTRRLSAKIDLGIQATLGFNVSGRYLLALGREGESPSIRLQLYKQALDGFTFGFNAEAGLTSNPGLEKKPDNFVKSVFGLHGLQILGDLRDWTDPKVDLSRKAARLIESEALDLLKFATGIDPLQELGSAHAILKDAIEKWHGLPQRASACLWAIIAAMDEDSAAKFSSFLAALAGPDTGKRASTIAIALQDPNFGSTREGRFLESIADEGLLSLVNQLDRVGNAATLGLAILERGVIRRIQRYVDRRLDLAAVLEATDPAQLNDWIAVRLGDFLDKELDLPALKEIQSAIRSILERAEEIYSAAIETITSRYSAEFAATYQQTKSGEVLIDAVFDLSRPDASRLFREIVVRAGVERLFMAAVDGVSIRQASLSHGIRRDACVKVHLPYLDSNTEHINESVASVRVEQDGGHILVYQFHSTDKILKKRYLSQMQIFGGMTDGAADPSSTVSYELLRARKGMTLADLEFRTRPFIDRYLYRLFDSNPSRVNGFYSALGNALRESSPGSREESGDILLKMQTSIAADVLGAWMRPLPESGRKPAAMRMSRALQERLREFIPLCYLDDPDRLQPNPPVAALLAWAALPISTSIDYDFESKRILRFDTEKEVFWNWPDRELRRAVLLSATASRNLSQALLGVAGRLNRAGRPGRAAEFDPRRTGDFQRMTIDDDSRAALSSLSSLLSTEALLVEGAAQALGTIQSAVAAAGGDAGKADPSRAIECLAEASAAMARTFNAGLASIYGGDALHALSSLLLVEASRSLAGETIAAPKAVLSLMILKPERSFEISDFLKGRQPKAADIVLSQSLIGI